MRLFFEPSDFLFFRDNKPFTGGENFGGLSRDLPLPQVVYGAVRTLLLQQAEVDFNRFREFKTLDEAALVYPIIRTTGLSDIAGSLRMRGPYLTRYDDSSKLADHYFPAPLDVVKFEKGGRTGGSRKLYTILSPSADASGQTNLPATFLQTLLVKPGLARPTEDLGNVVFSRIVMESYLDGSLEERTNSNGVEPVENLLVSEDRIGIAIGQNWVTKSGQFYMLEGRRMVEGVGLALELMGLDEALVGELSGQILHMGGERRFGRLLPLTGEGEIPVAPAGLANRFKMLLVTPALFSQGWLPGWLDPVNGQGTLPGSDLKVQLRSAAVGRAMPISGWDIAHNRPKPLRRAVPAGSVYYFELLNGDPAQVVELFHHSESISDEDGQAGFGLTLVGKW